MLALIRWVIHITPVIHAASKKQMVITIAKYLILAFVHSGSVLGTVNSALVRPYIERLVVHAIFLLLSGAQIPPI